MVTPYYREDVARLQPCHRSVAEQHVALREAFGLIANWCLMPDYAQIISDRIFVLQAKAAGIAMAHSDRPTVHYRCGKAGNYHHFGETPPPGVQPRPDYETALRRCQAAGNPALVAP